MFMRYTDLGIGHPVILRRMVRDCFGPMAPADALDVMNDDSDGRDGDSEGDEERDDEQEHDEEESDDELSDDLEELEDEGERDDEGGDGDGDVFDDDLSF
jgi:hypothetical protein